MKVIPSRYSYFEVYLTFRCNFKCYWCINAHNGIERKRAELGANEWILALKEIDSKIPITFGGGEPTIHSGFYDIMKAIEPYHKVDLLSNGSFKVKELMDIPVDLFTKKGPEYKSIRLSYHPGYTDENQIIEKAKGLQVLGYPVGIFGINHPNNLSKNVAMTEMCRESGVYFFIRDFLGFYDDKLYGNYAYPGALIGQRKKCNCRTEELLVGPDGMVFRCHRDLYANSNPIGNILNMAFEIEDTFRPCDTYGLCNPCDIKRKLSPDLTLSKCSVEIKDVEE